MSLNNEITLFIPERIINDKTLSNYSLTTYCVLHALSIATHMPIQCVTQYQIEFYLTGKLSKRKLITSYIKSGINELISRHVVEKIDEDKKHFVLDCSNLIIDTTKERFTVLYFSEVQKIFNVKNTNNFLLLKYFIFLVGTISSKTTVYLMNGEYRNRVVGNFTIDYLSDLSGISERTIIEYNKILEEIGLIYIYRHHDFVIDKENNIKSLVNVYGRACDSEYIKTFGENCQKYNSSYRYSKNNSSKVNNNRRLAQMYQQLLKGGGKDYTNEEILNIYHYVVSENNKYEKLFESKGYEEYLNKIRDIEIFDQYDFIKLRRVENIEKGKM